MADKFVSLEQYRLFQTRAINGKISKERFQEMVDATDLDSLPEKVEPEMTFLRGILIAVKKLPNPFKE
jgi:hypothetical protein